MNGVRRLQLIWHKYWIGFHNRSRHHHFYKRDEHWGAARKIMEKEGVVLNEWTT
jgi:hypothetical protein